MLHSRFFSRDSRREEEKECYQPLDQAGNFWILSHLSIVGGLVEKSEHASNLTDYYRESDRD